MTFEISGEFSGALSERVAIERWQAARDAAGDDAGAWVAVEDAFAAVQPEGTFGGTRAGEAARSGRRWRVMLRWRSDVDLNVRLRWRDQLLAVRAVAAVGQRGAFMTLICDGTPV